MTSKHKSNANKKDQNDRESVSPAESYSVNRQEKSKKNK